MFPGQQGPADAEAVKQAPLPAKDISTGPVTLHITPKHFVITLNFSLWTIRWAI